MSTTLHGTGRLVLGTHRIADVTYELTRQDQGRWPLIDGLIRVTGGAIEPSVAAERLRLELGDGRCVEIAFMSQRTALDPDGWLAVEAVEDIHDC